MRTLLRIDASVRPTGSHSRSLGDHFQTQWLKAHPDGAIVSRDLAASPIPHLNNTTVGAFMGNAALAAAAESSVSLSDSLITELKEADDVLVCSPVYNFHAPSTLKAYIDHVVRFGQTITADANGCHGLLTNKTAFIITACGGIESSPADCLAPFLAKVFRFMGFASAESALEGTATETGLQDRISQTRRQIDAWFDRS